MCRTKNGAWKNPNINKIFLWRIPIQNHLMLSIAEKRQNKATYLTQIFIRLKFMKKTSMPNSIKSFVYVYIYYIIYLSIYLYIYIYIYYIIYIYIYMYIYIYIYSATAWVVPDLWKALTILPDTSVKRYAVDQEDLKPFCCIQIIVWNSLHNKYAKCCEEFCLLQTKVFLRIKTYICNLWCNFGYKQHLFW